MPLFRKEDRDVVRASTVIFTLLATAFAFIAIVVAVHADSKTSAAAASGVQVSLSEFAISPAMINAPVGGKLVVSNTGTVEHNLTIEGTDAARRSS